MEALDLHSVLAERLSRHRLTAPLEDPSTYGGLFELLQPVAPVANSRPGSPPRLANRTTFDDGYVADRMRARREIVKGRFQDGRVGYVLAKDLALYANAFLKPPDRLSGKQQAVLDTIERMGPMTARQVKEETGLLIKDIMPALHRLQQAFLVYEDQVDEDWDRGWCRFESEWPGVVLDSEEWQRSAARVILRVLQANVFATFEQLKDWSGFNTKPLGDLIRLMEEEKVIVGRTMEGLGEGWTCSQEEIPAHPSLPSSVFMFSAADSLVRSHISELKRRYRGREVLQYLLIDGQFKGAVCGHWHIGPHDVEDIAVDLAAGELETRRGQIIDVVARVYHPPHSRILKCAGRAL